MRPLAEFLGRADARGIVGHLGAAVSRRSVFEARARGAFRHREGEGRRRDIGLILEGERNDGEDGAGQPAPRRTDSGVGGWKPFGLRWLAEKR